MPLPPSQERLVDRLRRSEFARVSLRTDDLSLELRRPSSAPVVTPSPEPTETVTAAPAAERSDVCAPAPGAVHLTAAMGSRVEVGDQVGTVQVHRRTVPIVATAAGEVTHLQVEDGAFVGFGDVVLVTHP